MLPRRKAMANDRVTLTALFNHGDIESSLIDTPSSGLILFLMTMLLL